MKTVIHSDNAPAAIGPYSQAISTGTMIFTSGQIPINPAVGKIEASDITGQAIQVMENLKAVLEAGGSGFDKVVKSTCFLADMADFAAFNAVYDTYFTSPEKPARSCFAVKQLPQNALVEVELVALV